MREHHAMGHVSNPFPVFYARVWEIESQDGSFESASHERTFFKYRVVAMEDSLRMRCQMEE